MDLAVETKGLTREFAGFRAVDGIDLAVPTGSFYGFLGPNGAGKSTTIKCLTGLLKPTAGTMRILGMDPLSDPIGVKRRIGVVPEDLALFDRLTAEETLSFVAQVHGIDDATAQTRAADLLNLMDLGSAANTLVTDFSHGMRKKLSLAAALLPAPRLLFLDEPFEGIDAVASRQIKDLLQGFVARGGTIFLTSHILEIVERLSTHIGVIARGRMVAQGRMDELRTGASDGRTLEELFIELVGGEAEIPRLGLDLKSRDMRILKAFAWMRWRVLMNSLERSGARDKLERFSLAIEQLGPIVTALLMIPSAILLAGAGGYSGWALAHTSRPLLFEVLRFLLLAACALTLIGPLLLPAGERTNAVRLLLLPISRPLLYVAQASTTLTDPWLALVVPAVAAIPIGLAIGGAWSGSIVAAVAAVLLITVLMGVSSLATSLIHLMLRDRRRGEIAALLFMLVLPMLGLFPSLMAGGDHRNRAERQADRRSGHERPAPEWIGTLQRRALPLVPSEMFVRSTRAAAARETSTAAQSLAGLATVTVLVHLVGFFVFGLVLDSPASAGSRRRKTAGRGRTWRVPGFSAATSAVAVNQVRLALRTPRGLSILLSPPVVFVMFSVMMSRGASAEFGFLRLGSGLALAIFGCWVSLLAILPLAMNQFSIDRAGLTLAFLSPLDDRDLLRGKALGNGIIIGLPALVCVLGAALFFRAGVVALWISVPFGLMATYFLVAPLAAALSAAFPRPVDLNSIGRGSNAHGLAGFVGFVAFTIAGAMSLGLAFLTINALDRPHWTPIVMAAWCAICAAVAHFLFMPVRALLSRRRENLALLR